MKLPLRLDVHAIRDAEGCVIVSGLNPCDMDERRQIVEYVNGYDAVLRRRAGKSEQIALACEKDADYRELAKETIPCIKAAIVLWSQELKKRGGVSASIENKIRNAEKLLERLVKLA